MRKSRSVLQHLISLGLASLSIVSMAACTFGRTGNEGTSTLRLSLSGGSPSSAAARQAKLAAQQSSTVGGVSLPIDSYDCFAVNVMGDDIPYLPRLYDEGQNPAQAEIEKSDRLIELFSNPAAFCPYPGIVSTVVPNSPGEAEIEVKVPRGKDRIIQVIGFMTQDGTCPSEVPRQINQLSTPSPSFNEYWSVLAQARSDLLDPEVTVTLSNIHDSANPKLIDNCHSTSSVSDALPPTISSVFSSTGNPIGAYSYTNNNSFLSWSVNAFDPESSAFTGTVTLHADSSCSTAALATSALTSGNQIVYFNGGPFADGIYTAKVMVTDSQGNTTSSCSAYFSGGIALVDTSPPSPPVFVLQPNANQLITYPGTSISLSWSSNGADFSQLEISLDGGNSYGPLIGAVASPIPGLSYTWTPGWGNSRTVVLRLMTTDYAGNNSSTTLTAQFALAPVVQLASGEQHTCARKGDGSVKCWGRSLNVGAVSTPFPSIGPTVPSTSWTGSAYQLSAGSNDTCLVNTAGDVHCWGTTGANLGEPATGVPGQVAALSNMAQVTVGTGFACGIKADSSRQVYCWGSNFYGELGTSPAGTPRAAPSAISDNSPFQEISAGNSHVCGIRSNGTVVCWGWGSSGQLGNSTTSDSSASVLVTGFTSAGPAIKPARINSGGNSTCMVLSDGSAKCWGAGSSYQLGNHTNTTSISSPTNVLDGVASMAWALKIPSLSKTGSTACYLKETGDVYCLGSDGSSFGSLGNAAPGSSSYGIGSSSAVLSSIIDISSGMHHHCAAHWNGSVYCWGNNLYQQLGLNPGTYSTLDANNNSIPVVGL